MSTTTMHHRNQQSAGPAGYLCWSHDNKRLEMTDLPGYLDSLQRSYDSLKQAYASMTTAPAWGAPAPSQDAGPYTKGRRHRHGEAHDQDDDCGCGSTSGCRCECCVEDADIVVYAHCGEVRMVPIEIENDTRKPRDDVSLDISDIRTAGGRVLPWSTEPSVQGPLVLDACSTTSFEIAVRVDCRPRDKADEHDGADVSAIDAYRGSKDVDECTVGYFTVRLGGCLTRPIVVAIAALPYSCDSYRTGCACDCCS